MRPFVAIAVGALMIPLAVRADEAAQLHRALANHKARTDQEWQEVQAAMKRTDEAQFLRARAQLESLAKPKGKVWETTAFSDPCLNYADSARRVGDNFFSGTVRVAKLDSLEHGHANADKLAEEDKRERQALEKAQWQCACLVDHPAKPSEIAALRRALSSDAAPDAVTADQEIANRYATQCER